MGYELDFGFIWNYRIPVLQGMLLTAQIFALSLVFSTIIALIVALLRLSESRILRIIAGAYVEFIRGTPLLAQLVWGFYVLPIFIGISFDAVTIAVVILSLHIGAYNAENFRAGIAGVRKTQIEAARSIGMSRMQTFWHVVAPQAAISVAPPFLNYAIILMKATALVSIIGTPDFLYRINQINMVELHSIELYTFAALVYLAVLTPINLVAIYFERTLRERWYF